jgi:hypothetical protein
MVGMGFLSGIYPLSPVSKVVYWRYPPDVGVVRGVTAVSIGLLIIWTGYRRWRTINDQFVRRRSVILLGASVIFLLIALSRDVFYGWYLLWSLPLFLMIRDRRLSLTVVLCLLLIYPSYTHDNFASLGFEENRVWSDEFDTANGWIVEMNLSSSGITPANLTTGVNAEDSLGRFWINASTIQNASMLDSVNISFRRAVLIPFKSTTEFATRILAGWDPTFGRFGDFSLIYSGYANDGSPINGSIVPTTSLFTNLTFILWRYAFSVEHPGVSNGTVTELEIVIHPKRAEVITFYIDYFYTTDSGLLNPIYFMMAPILIALALTAYVFLHQELENHPISSY